MAPSLDPVIVPSQVPVRTRTQAPARTRSQVDPSKPAMQAPVMEERKAAPVVKPEMKPAEKPAVKPEMKPAVKPETKPAAKPEVKPEAKPGPELDQMPFDENISDGALMQERVNVPGNMKVLEVPQNVPEEEAAPAELLPEDPVAPAESLELDDPLDDPAEPSDPAEPADPVESIDLDAPLEPAAPANSTKPENQELELPGVEDALPDELPDTLPDELSAPSLLEFPGVSEDSRKASNEPESKNGQQIMKAIQKRQPLKQILSRNDGQTELKMELPAQSSENPVEKQTASAPKEENELKSISFSDLRKATEAEEKQVKEVQSASWEVVEKEESAIKLTAGEAPVVSNPEPQPMLQEPVELPENVTIENFPERPSSAQPADEYIIDTQKMARKKDLKETQKGMVSGVEVKGNWEAETQNETGTFIFYDGIEGRSTVQSPDPVYIYAPRFRAVRQVIDLNVDEQVMTTGDLYTPTQVSTANRSMETSTTRQNQQAGTGTTRTVMLEAQANAGTGILDGNIAPQMKTQEAVIAQENRTINGPNAIDGKTRAITADGLIEIKAWTQTENMRVFIDQQSASASIQTIAAPSLYTVQEGEKKQDVKIYKVSSTKSAKPGETVDFIIYFENTGNTPIGNITLVDNLPARLEIVEDSAESSVDSNFTYEINGNGSQTLRWEVTQPLHVGEKGAVKFKALVR
ncbi:MAG: DUF11 domain-containing protein [Thermoguttaceae bacterium]|nr:DUF11 domain-containing protein [Thermoguttaceae bacterium]